MELENQSAINPHDKLRPIKPRLALNLLCLHLPLGQVWNVPC